MHFACLRGVTARTSIRVCRGVANGWAPMASQALIQPAESVSAHWVCRLRPGGAVEESLPSRRWESGVAALAGELHNRAELAAQLDLRGGDDSPSSVLRQAWLRWGEDAFRRLRGVFAALVVDERREVALAARDAIGVHSLFYCEAGGDVLASPSIGCLLREAGVSCEVNRPALADQLARRWPFLDETFYSGVKRVPPGHLLEVRPGLLRVRRWWDPPEVRSPADWVPEEEVHRFGALLEQAVERCLRLGKPGIFLSGGFDSISVAAVAADACESRCLAPPHALSLAFPDPRCNEAGRQVAVARALGMAHTLLDLGEAAGTRGVLGGAVDLAESWPAPLMNVWRAAYLRLGTEGRQHGCGVLLTGAGGDDWLTVNPLYMADLLRRRDLGGAARFLLRVVRSYELRRLALIRYVVWSSGLRPLVGLGLRCLHRRLDSAGERARRRRRLLEERKLPDWLAPDPALRRACQERMERRAEEALQRQEPSGSFGFYFRNAHASFFHPVMPMDHEEDFEAGLRMGVPIRHPYWDQDLVEFLYRVPPDLLMRGGREKGLVRAAVAARFPDLGFQRHKKVSAVEFFTGLVAREAPGCWKSLGGVRALASAGIVDAASASELVEQGIRSGGLQAANRTWELLGAEAWLRGR